MIATSFGASAQCNAQSTAVNTSCGGSWCVTVQIQTTGFLEVENSLMDSSSRTMYRKPNFSELSDAIEQLESYYD